MNIGAPWPDLYEAESRVLAMQTKLHQWATNDFGRRFDDLYNLVYDPAWSEVIIADALSAAGVDFAYERAFRGHDGTIRLPDFTIEDATTGELYIWEFLGLPSNPQYARAWDRKQA